MSEPMRTDTGPGALRERLALNRCSMEAERSACYAEVDEILAEIADAGFRLVESGRLERLVTLGTMAAGLSECSDERCVAELCDIVRTEAAVMQVRGDLEPGEGAS